MPTTIPDHFKVSYSNDVALQAQRRVSDLQATVMVDRVEGEQKFYDDYSPRSLRRKPGRNAKHDYVETKRNRRLIQPEDYGDAELIDRGDQGAIMRMMQSDSAYTSNLLAAVERGKDQEIFLAYEGIAFGGKKGEIQYTFDTNNTVDFSTASTSVQQYYDKILEMGQILDDNNVEDDGERYFVYPPLMHRVIKRIAQMTSGDFVDTKILPSGRKAFVFDGFTFVRTTTGADPEVNLPDRCYAYHKSAMVMGERDDYGIGVHIDTIPENWHSEQFAVYLQIDAARRFESRIVRGIDIPATVSV